MTMLIISLKKACQKYNALGSLAPFMNVNKKRIIMKAFVESAIWILPISLDVP